MRKGTPRRRLLPLAGVRFYGALIHVTISSLLLAGLGTFVAVKLATVIAVSSFDHIRKYVALANLRT